MDAGLSAIENMPPPSLRNIFAKKQQKCFSKEDQCAKIKGRYIGAKDTEKKGLTARECARYIDGRLEVNYCTFLLPGTQKYKLLHLSNER